jgi:hypothetical protein
MKTLDTQDLSAVSGGSTSTNTEMTQALTAVQSSIKDLAANNNNNNSSSNMLLPIMMMAMNRPQPTVVAAAPAPVINISNRFRRW